MNNSKTKPQTINNMFKSNRINNNTDSPIKNHLIQNKKYINNNNLKTIDYSSTNEKRIERKISGKSNKSKYIFSQNKNGNIYKNDSLVFEPFSPKRILTIPTQNNHYGYSIDDNGETELLDDPYMDEKFNGTKNNSIGPGQYNIIISPRKRLIIDWSKLSEERKLKKQKIKILKR